MAPRSLTFLALLAALLSPQHPAQAPARAALLQKGPLVIEGAYESPLGRLEVEVTGASSSGKLLVPAQGCPFAAGEEALLATLLDDSVVGKLLVRLRGGGCGASEVWGTKEDATFGRQAGVSGQKARRARARAAVRDVAGWLREGNFEAARRQFLAGLSIDPAVPDAFNGVGVTDRMRNDLGAALEWYKKALAVDSDFGDAHNNMACVHALEGEKALALRYLQIASLNGYASAEGIDVDLDLALRDELAYRALVRANL